MLWFEFTGRPSNGNAAPKSAAGTLSSSRKHSVRIEQQPLGGATALIFAADLRTGGKGDFRQMSQSHVTVGPVMPPQLEFLVSPLQHF